MTVTGHDGWLIEVEPQNDVALRWRATARRGDEMFRRSGVSADQAEQFAREEIEKRVAISR